MYKKLAANPMAGSGWMGPPPVSNRPSVATRLPSWAVSLTAFR
jgi:hypothetical protein